VRSRRGSRLAGLALVVLASCLLPSSAVRTASGEGLAIQADPGPPKPEVRTEPLPAGPRSPQERTAVIVFLAWMWPSILVLIYVLRLKVRELDRLASFEEPPSNRPNDGGPAVR